MFKAQSIDIIVIGVMFKLTCSSCFKPIADGTGYAMSCTCFVCGNCSSEWNSNSRFDRCVLCGCKEPQLASLTPESIPEEISNLLSNIDDKMESLLESMRFQANHSDRVKKQAVAKMIDESKEREYVQRSLTQAQHQIAFLSKQQSSPNSVVNTQSPPITRSTTTGSGGSFFSSNYPHPYPYTNTNTITSTNPNPNSINNSNIYRSNSYTSGSGSVSGSVGGGNNLTPVMSGDGMLWYSGNQDKNNSSSLLAHRQQSQSLQLQQQQLPIHPANTYPPPSTPPPQSHTLNRNNSQIHSTTAITASATVYGSGSGGNDDESLTSKRSNKRPPHVPSHQSHQRNIRTPTTVLGLQKRPTTGDSTGRSIATSHTRTRMRSPYSRIGMPQGKASKNY